MKPVLSITAMKQSENKAMLNGVSSRELMYRAALGLYHSVESWKEPVGIFCGSGNNGGDGYALALILKCHKIDTILLSVKEPQTADAIYYRDECKKKNVKIVQYKDSDNDVFASLKTVVDCIFGIGFHGAPSGIELKAIREINCLPCYTISADINSGLNGDTGIASECVKSDLTVAIGFFKTGHFLNHAKDHIAQLTVADLCITPSKISAFLIDEKDVRFSIPQRKNNSNKSNYGYIGLVGGSQRYSGAIRLASLANAAMRSGAGVVKIATGRALLPLLAPLVLESTLFPFSDDGHGNFIFVEEEWHEYIAGLKVIAIGMGLGLSPETEKAIRFLLKEYSGKLIIDADGLNALSLINPEYIKESKCDLILTPHMKQFSRLTHTDIQQLLVDPFNQAIHYARETKSVLLLKGPSTLVTDGVETFIVPTGCPGMATAGSGDVLSGILSALCAYGNGALHFLVASGAWINGSAGESAQKKYSAVSMIASDTIKEIPEIIKRLQDQ